MIGAGSTSVVERGSTADYVGFNTSVPRGILGTDYHSPPDIGRWDEVGDPLAPPNSLAIPLVTALRDLRAVKQRLESAEIDTAAYRVLAHVAIAAQAAAVLRNDRAQHTIRQLREELTQARLGPGLRIAHELDNVETATA